MSLFSSVKFSSNIPTHVKRLLESAADYSGKEQWEIALTLSIIALKELENALGSDSHDVGLALTIVGSININVDKYDEAESLWKRAISILEKYDDESNLIVKILWKRVELSTKNHRYQEAEILSKRAMEIYQKLRIIDPLELHRQKFIIGKLYLHLARPNEAKKFLSAALPVYARKFGNCSTQVQEIFGLLEAAYFWKNNIAESKESFENSNEITDAISLCSLGMLCENIKLASKAIDYHERAVKIYESKGFLDHSQLADIRLKLGKCYLRMSNYIASENHLSKSLDIYKKTLADDDPMMLDIKMLMAYGYVKSAKYHEARSIYEEILDNVYTNGSDVSVLEWARNNERYGEDQVPILSGKLIVIVPVLWNLKSLYILNYNYRVARILKKLAEFQQYLIEHNEV